MSFPCDNEQIQLALRIAERAHKGQFRRDGKTPYITHPIAVAEILWKERNRALFQSLGAAALLHDVIEDSPISARDLIIEGVAIDVVDAVRLLTHVTHDKDDRYVDYILKLRENMIARWVKIADIKHNLQTSMGTMKDKYELALYILRFGK